MPAGLSGMFRTEVAVAVAVALALGLLLLALRPADRANTRRALVALGLCVLAEAVAKAIDALGAPRAAGLVADAAAIGIGVLLIRLVAILTFRSVLPVFGLRPARIVEDLVSTALFAAWGLLWLRLAGVDLASLVATSAVITAVLAFSMQETLGNVLGGVVLQLDRSIRQGDWVRIDDVSGRVTEVRWRYTAVETRNHETVVIPNGWLMKNRFMVIGARGDARLRWRRWVWFSVDPAAAPTRVIATLENAVLNAEIPHVASDLPPSAVLMDGSGGSSRYALRYWLADPQADDPTDSLVRAHALAALARHGMRIAVPVEERLIVTEDAARKAAQHAGEVARRRAALAGVYLFAPLAETERAALAERLIDAPFVQGATITRQGAVAHWLYIVVAGQAEVWAESRSARTLVSTLGAGSVFGVMGMMTGEPRRATVAAKTDVECYRLDKAGFEEILRARPDIAGEISRLLAEREAELEKFREAARMEQREPPRREAILKRIRAFFGLDAA